MRNFSIYSSYFLKFRKMHEMGFTKKSVLNSDGFHEDILNGLLRCHLFNIEDGMKKLFCLTKTPLVNDDLCLPFDYMFLDVEFGRSELKELGFDLKCDKIIGLLVRKGNLIDKSNEIQVGEGLRVSPMTIYTNEVRFDTYNSSINLNKDWDNLGINVKIKRTHSKKIKNFCTMFAINFLNYINSVDYRDESVKPMKSFNKKRVNKGKLPVPVSHYVKVNKTISSFVSSLSSGNSNGYNYRFFVRGHFRRLKSDVYKRKKIIWISPFLKGRGILIDKEYEVKK